MHDISPYISSAQAIQKLKARAHKILNMDWNQMLYPLGGMRNPDQKLNKWKAYPKAHFFYIGISFNRSEMNVKSLT